MTSKDFSWTEEEATATNGQFLCYISFSISSCSSAFKFFSLLFLPSSTTSSVCGGNRPSGPSFSQRHIAYGYLFSVRQVPFVGDYQKKSLEKGSAVGQGYTEQTAEESGVPGIFFFCAFCAACPLWSAPYWVLANWLGAGELEFPGLKTWYGLYSASNVYLCAQWSVDSIILISRCRSWWCCQCQDDVEIEQGAEKEANLIDQRGQTRPYLLPPITNPVSVL